jgi:hypothetical protein
MTDNQTWAEATPAKPLTFAELKAEIDKAVGAAMTKYLDEQRQVMFDKAFDLPPTFQHNAAVVHQPTAYIPFDSTFFGDIKIKVLRIALQGMLEQLIREELGK